MQSTRILNQNTINIDRLAAAGKEIDRGGLTKAGRGLMKHGSRPESVFPKPLGNPAQINECGQKMLEMILNHPERKIVFDTKKRYGSIMDVEAPSIGGARFSADGETFIGFLEP